MRRSVDRLYFQWKYRLSTDLCISRGPTILKNSVSIICRVVPGSRVFILFAISIQSLQTRKVGSLMLSKVLKSCGRRKINNTAFQVVPIDESEANLKSISSRIVHVSGLILIDFGKEDFG